MDTIDQRVPLLERSHHQTNSVIWRIRLSRQEAHRSVLGGDTESDPRQVVVHKWSLIRQEKGSSVGTDCREIWPDLVTDHWTDDVLTAGSELLQRDTRTLSSPLPPDGSVREVWETVWRILINDRGVVSSLSGGGVSSELWAVHSQSWPEAKSAFIPAEKFWPFFSL